MPDLAGVVKAYHAREEWVPLIIHIDDPDVIRQCDYMRLFPYVEIAPVAQAGLHDKSTTLKINLFGVPRADVDNPVVQFRDL